MEYREIRNIGVEHIHPHPDNPRKDLGELSELAESIKKNGVMQNLTVIPIEGKAGEYLAVIGHRRHAAAKLAGIAEVPCMVIEGFSKKEQVGTMLEENMQRNDLTIYEQAQGFQMMMDLGETEETIAEKTGFSKTTIRRRLNIAKLDQKELQAKERDKNFQLTLTDLYELEKVEDIKTRNKILKEAKNSREIIWKAQNAAAEAERAKKIDQISKMLEELGVEKAPKGADAEQYSEKWQTVKDIDLDKDVPKRITLKETGKMYYLPYYRSVRIIKKTVNKKPVLTPEESRRKQKDKDMKVIKAKMKEMSTNRKEFIQNIISGKIAAVKDENNIREMAWKVMVEAGWYLSQSTMRGFFLEKEEYKCTEEERQVAKELAEGLSFTHSMLVAMHFAMEGTKDIYDWLGHYEPQVGAKLQHGYEALQLYGWTFANEEDERLLDGTHELYVSWKG
ncbi:MAG: ParB/RepB/Spo0J family partition protein [Hungatella sp.]